MGGGDDGLPPLSMTQSADPNFLRASALIRLSKGSRIGLTTGQDDDSLDWTGLAGPPSTQEVPPSGIRVTFTSAKSFLQK
jgi:hypothetical protein